LAGRRISFLDSKRQRTYPTSHGRALSNDFHRERSESCAFRTSGFEQIRELLPDCVSFAVRQSNLLNDRLGTTMVVAKASWLNSFSLSNRVAQLREAMDESHIGHFARFRVSLSRSPPSMTEKWT
jgi:hypothetical protein